MAVPLVLVGMAGGRMLRTRRANRPPVYLGVPLILLVEQAVHGRIETAVSEARLVSPLAQSKSSSVLCKELGVESYQAPLVMSQDIVNG
jgi:hypothetical protein